MHLLRDALPEPPRRARLTVVGLGNPWRSDDAAGLVAARRLRGRLPADVGLLEQAGEPTSLLDALDGVHAAWLIDAVSSGASPGTVHRLEAGERELPAPPFGVSSHHLGLAEALELARAVGRLPRRVVVYGIEGARFEAGDELSPSVAAAAEEVAAAIRDEVLSCTGER